MPLCQTGLAYSGGNVDWKTHQKLEQVFALIDQKVKEFARARGLRSCRLMDAFVISSLPHCVDQDLLCSKAPLLHGRYPASPLLQT